MSAVRRVGTLDLPATLGDLRRLESALATSAPRPPPPHDLDAERVVVTALVEAHADLGVLVGIDAADMYDPLHSGIVDAVRSGGLGIWRSAAAELARTTPTTLGRGLDDAIATVRRLAHCRRALHDAELACARLRAGDPDVIDLLRRAAGEVLHG